MATLEKAIALAALAHAGQRDKQGQPYILHPLRLMLRVQGEAAQIAAVLHDVVEDSSFTEDDLRQTGFAEPVLDAVRCLTHQKGEPYAEYVIRLSANPVARQVKIADLEDNTRPDRALVRAGSLRRDLARLHRYHLSHKFLTGELSLADYRAAMNGHP